MAVKVILNHAAVAALLRGGKAAELTKAAAEKVAEHAREQDIQVGDHDGGPREIALPVSVRMVETDRAHAIVALAHPSGSAVQAKHGVLTKAAAAAGLEVRS